MAIRAATTDRAHKSQNTTIVRVNARANIPMQDFAYGDN